MAKKEKQDDKKDNTKIAKKEVLKKEKTIKPAKVIKAKADEKGIPYNL